MRSLLCTSFLLGAAIVIGCEKKPEQPKVDTNKTVPSAAETKAAADRAADQTKSAAGDMADKAKTAAGDAAAKTSDAAKTATDATKDAGKSAADATKSAADAAKAPAAGATDAVRTQASDLMTKLSDAIKNNRLNEAQTYIDKIESIKTSLPADLQDQYVKLKSAYEKMKAGSTLLNK